MSGLSRREFLKGTAAATAFPLVTISGTKSSGQVIGANEAVRVAVAGIPARVVSDRGSAGYVNRTNYPPIQD